MPKYVAFIRGINVGSKWVKMAALIKSFETLGAENIETYVQSGNVVFDFKKTTQSALQNLIQARILKDFKFEVPVLVKTADEIKKTIRGNPFVKQKGVDLTKLHVTFLDQKPAKAGLAKLEVLPTRNDEYVLVGTEIYLQCPINYGETKLSNTAIEKALEVQATTRNWKTVNAVFEMISCGES
jgi:uncharacterized protein (DUF1697 family)